MGKEQQMTNAELQIAMNEAYKRVKAGMGVGAIADREAEYLLKELQEVQIIRAKFVRVN